MRAPTSRRTLQLAKLIHGRNQILFPMARYRAYATAKEVKDFDVVIVGGGPVGLALTCALGMFTLL
jgi:NADPH-dependent 2,4-dienoyl-CoA reductase/sulfur reductase-like enzyme